jgi:hypothetical protein
VASGSKALRAARHRSHGLEITEITEWRGRVSSVQRAAAAFFVVFYSRESDARGCGAWPQQKMLRCCFSKIP